MEKENFQPYAAQFVVGFRDATFCWMQKCECVCGGGGCGCVGGGEGAGGGGR
jgi:hypothetical protein